MKTSWSLVLGVAVALVATTAFAAPDFASMQVTPYETPKPAPAFTLPDLNGKQVHLSDLRGRVVVLFFWATGGDRAVPPKLADTDGQIQRLWHNISTQCVSIASSIDTTPPEMIPHEMRERWLRELRKTAVGCSSGYGVRRAASAESIAELS